VAPLSRRVQFGLHEFYFTCNEDPGTSPPPRIKCFPLDKRFFRILLGLSQTFFRSSRATCDIPGNAWWMRRRSPRLDGMGGIQFPSFPVSARKNLSTWATPYVPHPIFRSRHPFSQLIPHDKTRRWWVGVSEGGHMTSCLPLQVFSNRNFSPPPPLIEGLSHQMWPFCRTVPHTVYPGVLI